MTRKSQFIPVAVACMLVLACNVIKTPSTRAPDANVPGADEATSNAATRIFEIAVQTAAAGQQALPTNQVSPPTNQPPAPTAEPTAGAPLISASMDTNCREGPSTVYEAISYLLVGKTSEVVNKYQNGQWWVIKDPNNPAKRCWVWGQTTSVTGNWQQLPEATVPPTPTVELSLDPVMTSLAPPAWVGPCPVVLFMTGTITANMAVSVSYVWARSSGPNLGSGSVSFSEAGTKNVSFSIPFLGTSGGTVSLKIVSPLTVTSNSLPYNIVCMP